MIRAKRIGTVVLVCFVLVFSCVSSSSAYSSYAEVKIPADIIDRGDQEAILLFMSEGVLNGYPDGLFYPDKGITRAEILKMCNHLAEFFGNEPEYDIKEVKFKDVKRSDWYYEHLIKALSYGYIEGFTDNTFRPNKVVSRAEIAALYARASKSEVEDALKYAQQYDDYDEFPSWAREYIGNISSDLTMRGVGNNRFEAFKPITRGQVTIVAHNLIWRTVPIDD